MSPRALVSFLIGLCDKAQTEEVRSLVEALVELARLAADEADLRFTELMREAVELQRVNRELTTKLEELRHAVD